MSELALDPRNRSIGAAPIPEHERHARGDYLMLPKKFGTVDTELLEDLASRLEKSALPQDLECAASALLEAAVFSPDRSPDTLEDDLFVVDYAEHLLKEAIHGYWQKLEQGWHYDDQYGAIKAEVQLDCIDLYRGILQRKITPEIRNKVFNSLSRRGRYAYRQTELSSKHYSSDSYSVATEIATLMGGLTEEGILVPSTPRGGSGEKGDISTTHDFNYLAFDDDGNIGLCVGMELKGYAKNDLLKRMGAELRYDQDRIVLMYAHDLGIHWDSMPEMFSHTDLTFAARRAFTPVRWGIYQHVSNLIRKQESGKTGPEAAQTDTSWQTANFLQAS